jgi:hypothetical protein
VRAVVGDPRTIFTREVGADPSAPSGTFSFHDGVDIDAPEGTIVYPAVSGFVRWVIGRTGVLVQAPDGRLFVYKHIVPAVRQWQEVSARKTVLGRVHNWAQELHFSEYTADKRVVNPLVAGHLAPYSDTSKPRVASVRFRDARGDALLPFELHGRVNLIADAYDRPTTPTAWGSMFPVSNDARERLGVAPAAVFWSLAELGGRMVVPRRTVVDFRHSLPRNEAFWRVYARGTYQNRPAIGNRLHREMHGRYLFRLTPKSFDTRKLDDGAYVLRVTAIDARGNKGSLGERIEVRNWGPRHYY